MQYRFHGHSPSQQTASPRLVPTALALTAFVAALSATPAFAANALTSAQVQVSPAFESATIRVVTTGDDNQNAGGQVRFRPKGQTNWQAGHELVRSLPTRLNSLLFNLREGTTYDLQITPTDPDGSLAPITTTFTTRTTPMPGNGRRIYVSPTGSPVPNGTPTAPYGLVTDALKVAQPGDTVFLLPGTYREWVYIDSTSGRPGAPITIKGAPGAVFRGDVPALSNPHTAPLWRREADGSWSTPLPTRTYYAAMNGCRLYHYLTQPALQSARAEGKYGWWQDASNRIYVTLPGGISPDTVPMQIAQTDKAFTLLGVHDLIIDGFEIGYYGITDSGIGVYLNGADNITVRNCTIHNVQYPIFTKDSASQNLFERNVLGDRGMESWAWSAIKGTDAEGTGILIGTSGSGNVVRRNTISGVFNGIVSDGGGDASSDTDVYYNWIHDVGDDGIEPEGGAANFRAWCNTVRNCQNGVSLAPIGVGPAWILYNTISDFRESGLKISNSTTGPLMVYHNTIVTMHTTLNALSPWSPMTNLTMRNNIVMGTRYVLEDLYTGSGSNASFDGDLLYTTDPTRFVKLGNTRYDNLAQLQASGQEAHGLSGDPKFTGAIWGDFHLQATSPARHRAVPIPGINDFFGTTPDIGALQMGK